MTTDDEHIPEEIRDVLHTPELANLRDREGWAKGEIALIEDTEVSEEIDEVFLELFNGEGTAGEFGGVRAYAVTDGNYRENYAYATREAFDESEQVAGWVVTKWTDPVDPDYGDPAP